jgi:zinc D-Ala-D-Ala dipeptidase
MKNKTNKLHDARLISYRELNEKELGENNEPFRGIPEEIVHNSCTYPFVRATVVNKLVAVAKELRLVNANFRLEVLSAYRPPQLQSDMYNSVIEEITSRCPQLIGDDLKEEAHKFVAVPSVAAHPTGGAVDVTVFDVSQQRRLDMGTIYLEFTSELLPTFSENLTNDQRNNRMLIREAMMNAEFAPYNGEWWHFSFGDREWAAFYEKPRSLYSPIVLETL